MSFLSLFNANPVHKVFYVVVLFSACAIMMFAMSMDLVASVVLLLYVGAVVVLFLFVVMMLGLEYKSHHRSVLSWIIVAIPCCMMMCGFYALFLGDISIARANVVRNLDRISLVQMYSEHKELIIISSIVLMIPMFASACLTTKEGDSKIKQQNTAKQIATGSRDAVELLDIAPNSGTRI